MSKQAVSFVLAVLLAVVIALPALAEPTAYAKITASQQGAIKGGVTLKGREGMIAVIASVHDVSQAVDTATGRSSGRRIHKPFVITKELDKSSVPLRTAFAQNESLKEVVLQYYAPKAVGAAGGAGADVLYLTVTLTKARIVDIKHVMPNNRDPELARLAAYEEISFVYDEISWTWADGGLSANDDVTSSVK